MEKHAVKVGYLPEVLVKMRTGGKANRLVGITQGNREILDAFQLNGIRVSPYYFFRKPFMKFAQIVSRHTAEVSE
jgi:hypothetical protein